MTFFRSHHLRESRWAALLVMTLVLLACGGGGAPPSASSGLPKPTRGANVMPGYVDAGPGNNEVNRLYTDVTICQPGNPGNCQTIDHVLVDTGSTGLRLLAGLVNTSITQTRVNTGNATPLLNCTQFLDGSYAWGPVARVDLRIDGQTVSDLPVQLMGDNSVSNLDGGCSGNGQYTAILDVDGLGAKGILGISYFAQDCGVYCTSQGEPSLGFHNKSNGYYYTCTSEACNGAVGATPALTDQLTNPVVRLNVNNNGFIINLPAAISPGSARLTGEVIFGIGTQVNNAFAAGAVLTTDPEGYVQTKLINLNPGQTFNDGFIDTGSNGIFFDSTINLCSKDWYCPANPELVSASITGKNGQSTSISFTVGNAQRLFSQANYAVIPALAGPIGEDPANRPSAIFDWGLPFYYGRKVYQAIDGASTPAGIGPFMAF